jgi:hypothetical protein
MITDLLCVESSCDVQIAAQRTQGTNGNSNGHANRSVRFGSCQRPRLFIPKIRSDLTIHLIQALPSRTLDVTAREWPNLPSWRDVIKSHLSI